MFSKPRGLAAFFFICLAAGCSRSKPAAIAPPPRTAVLRCENLSPDAGLDWMGRAISEILAIELSGVAGNQFVLPSAVRGTAAALGVHPAKAPGISTEREAAMAAGANRLMACAFDAQAGLLQISAQVEDTASMKVVERAYAEGATGDILAVAGKLAAQFSHLARPSATHSAEAIRAYAEGLDAADAGAAGEAYARAVAADPNFGPAYLAWLSVEMSRRNRAGAEHIFELAKARGDGIAPYDRARLALAAAELQGDNAARVQALSALAKTGPPDASVERALGDLALQGRRYRDAVNAYQRAMAIAPGDIAVLNSLGYSQAYLGDLNGALDALRKYEQLQPNQANPIDSQADVNFYFGHYADAEKLYLAAQAKDPNFLGGAELLKAAQARLATGDTTGAEAIFQRYIGLLDARKDPAAGYRKAQWKYLTGHRREAIAMLAAEPSQALEYQAQIAIWELSLGDPSAADRVAKAMAKAQGRPPLLLFLASFLTQPQASAAEWEARAARMFPKGAFQDQMIAHALLFGRKYADALPYLRRSWEQTHPNNEEGLPVLLGWAMLETGKADGVTSLIGPTPVPQATGLGPLLSLYFPRLFYLRSLNYDRQGKHDLALENYRLFLKLAGSDAEIWGDEQSARKALGQ